MWKWIIGGALLIGVGSCVVLLGGLLSDANAKKDEARALIAAAADGDLPPASEWSIAANVQPAGVEQLKARLIALGAPETVSDPSCGARASTDTDKDTIDGRIVHCEVEVVYAAGKFDVDIQWRKEDDVWKLLFYGYQLQGTPDQRGHNTNNESSQ